MLEYTLVIKKIFFNFQRDGGNKFHYFCHPLQFKNVTHTYLVKTRSEHLRNPDCPTKNIRLKIFIKPHKFCKVVFGCLIIQFNLTIIHSIKLNVPCLTGCSVLVLAMLDSRTVSGLKSRILWRWAGTFFVLNNFLPVSLEESIHNQDWKDSEFVHYTFTLNSKYFGLIQYH